MELLTPIIARDVLVLQSAQMSAAAIAPEQIAVERVSLKPFPPEHLDKLWAWMHEFPKANFDDTAPDGLEGFRRQQMGAALMARKLIGVELDGELVGAIGFQRTAPTIGNFAGVCFTRSVHGTGLAALAVRAVLAALWAEGCTKVSAAYFADNRRVHHFLKKLGAVEEAYLKAETTRNGKPVDVRRVAFLRPEEAV